MGTEKLWLIVMHNDKWQTENVLLYDYDSLIDSGVINPTKLTLEEASETLGGPGWEADEIVVVEVIDGNTKMLPIGCELRAV